MRVCRDPRSLGEQRNTIIYFKGTKGIFGINLMEQWISLLLKGTLTKKFREQWLGFILRTLERRKSEIFQFKGFKGTCCPGKPWFHSWRNLPFIFSFQLFFSVFASFWTSLLQSALNDLKKLLSWPPNVTFAASWNRYHNTPNYSPPGGESHIERTWVLVGNFEKNPLELPRFCFVGVVRNVFHPMAKRYQF